MARIVFISVVLIIFWFLMCRHWSLLCRSLLALRKFCRFVTYSKWLSVCFAKCFL